MNMDWGSIAQSSAVLDQSGFLQNSDASKTILSSQGAETEKIYFDYSIVGINANNIPVMQEEIKRYIANVNSKLENMNAFANPTEAFQGEEIGNAIKHYLNAIKEACSAMVSQMNNFNNQLEEVKAAYLGNDQSSSSTVQGSTTTVNGAFQTAMGTK